MKTPKYHIYWVSLILIAFIAGGCKRNSDALPGTPTTVNLQFSHVISGSPFVLGNTYANDFGESFTATKYKYYISKIRLENTLNGNHAAINENYFLVDEALSSSKNINFNTTTGSYNAVSFLMGVDSIRNVSGAQTDALDPANGMFWTWNSGYIMAKFEGQSPQSNQVNNIFEYHIGGFKDDKNVVKRITLMFPSPIQIKNNQQPTISIQGDIKKWFKNSIDLPIATNPVCVMPGSLAMQFAANYTGMFTIHHIENN
jgi:hypothetical protein